MKKYLDYEGLQTLNDNLDTMFATADQVRQILNEQSERVSNYDILCIVDDTIDAYKIRIHAEYTNRKTGTLLGLQNASFDNLTYDRCLTPYNPAGTTENVVFINADNIEFNCTLTMSSRNSDNNHDDNAPHNLFAPSDKRMSLRNRVVGVDKAETFTYEIQFLERVPYTYASQMTYYFYNNGGDINVTYQLINSDNKVVYEHVTNIEDQTGRIYVTPSDEEPVELEETEPEIINVVEMVERGDIFA